jgi:hypothetical protein
MPELVSDLSAAEVANYTAERFTHEPGLWRVHLRAIRAVLASIESTTGQGDQVARILERAEFFFLVGLSAVGVAFATLIVEVAF